ncbi:MAG: VTT domain-containing protein [Candidatus Bathyarchaeia archaeon]
MKKAKAYIIFGIIIGILAIAGAWLSRDNLRVFKQIVVQDYGYIGILISTIIAGSIIPFGSPIIVATTAAFGLNITNLALVASTGYTLGVLTCYIPAWLFGEAYVKKKVGEETFQKYSEIWNKYGYKLSMLFSVIPGFPVDLLALICGCFHTKAKFFIPICWFALFIQFLICGIIGQFLGVYLLQ